MRRRVALALAVSRDLPDVTFVPIGGVGRHSPAEAVVMAQLLEHSGVDRAAIHPVSEGRTTIHSLEASWPYLRERTEGRGALVHVCTDAYHVRRCRLILRIWGIESRGPGGGTARDVSAAAPVARGLAWMTLRDWLALIEDVPLAVLWRVRRRFFRAQKA